MARARLASVEQAARDALAAAVARRVRRRVGERGDAMAAMGEAAELAEGRQICDGGVDVRDDRRLGDLEAQEASWDVLTAYLVGLAALSEATAAMPRVSLLERAWDTLSAAVLAMPKAADTAPKFETYSLLQASLPTPPTALLDPGFELHAKIAAVPTRVSHGQHSVQSTHADTLRQLELLEIGMFGDDKLGYTASIIASKPDVDALLGCTPPPA